MDQDGVIGAEKDGLAGRRTRKRVNYKPRATRVCRCYRHFE